MFSLPGDFWQTSKTLKTCLKTAEIKLIHNEQIRLLSINMYDSKVFKIQVFKNYAVECSLHI